MSKTKPTRQQGDLAEMLDTLLDKGVVINADIAVSVGDTELLGIELRAAVASFETAAAYGLQFPAGTDMERVHDAAGVDPLERPEGDVLAAPERAATAPDADDAPSPETDEESPAADDRRSGGTEDDDAPVTPEPDATPTGETDD